MPFRFVDANAVPSQPTDVSAVSQFQSGALAMINDPALGTGRAIYLQAGGTINAGDLCEISQNLSGGQLNLRAVQSSLGANQNRNLVVALSAMTVGQYGWFVYEGPAIINVSGAVAVGDRAFFNAAGVVQSAAVAGRQALGVQAVTVNNAVIAGYGASIGATKAVYYVSPGAMGQGQIT